MLSMPQRRQLLIGECNISAAVSCLPHAALLVYAGKAAPFFHLTPPPRSTATRAYQTVCGRGTLTATGSLTGTSLEGRKEMWHLAEMSCDV